MEMIDDFDKYLQGLLNEIERIRTRHGTGLFRINDKITKRVAERTKKYFESKPEYHIDIKRCATCTGTWDVIITFRGV
jgi:hypothetical protein